MRERKSRHLADKVIPRDDLAREVARQLGDRKLTQAAAARVVGDAPSQLSVLLAGNLDGFSAERLIRWLVRLGTDVDIVLRPGTGDTPGRVKVRRR